MFDRQRMDRDSVDGDYFNMHSASVMEATRRQPLASRYLGHHRDPRARRRGTEDTFGNLDDFSATETLTEIPLRNDGRLEFDGEELSVVSNGTTNEIKALKSWKGGYHRDVDHEDSEFVTKRPFDIFPVCCV